MKNQKKRPQAKFTLEFKQDAVKLITEKGYTHKPAADSLDISLSAIGRSKFLSAKDSRSIQNEVFAALFRRSYKTRRFDRRVNSCRRVKFSHPGELRGGIA
jgi:hypothetical protein